MTLRVAVVTPYFQETPEILRQCHESVLGQKFAADHVLVADGHPSADVSGWNARHIVLPRSSDDNGNTPRSIGSIYVKSQSYDFIAYLDADNWYRPDHLSSLMELWQTTAAPVCCAWRTFHRLDGTLLEVTDEEENRKNHVDTSCLLIHRGAFECLDAWHRMPKWLSPICDRIFFGALKARRYGMAFSEKRTVAFRSQYAAHYTRLGLVPPEGAKSFDATKKVYERLGSLEGIRETVREMGIWPL